MLASLAAAALFLVLAVIAPGVAAQRLARVPVDPALVLPLGTALCAGAYAAGRAAGAPGLFAFFVLAALAGAAWAWRRPADAGPRAEPGPSLRGALPPFLALVALLALTQYRFNRLDRASGDFLLDPLLTYDTTFHVGVTRELTLGWPPQVPGLAGFTLGYHLGLDLVRAAALDWARVDPFDSISRFDVTWNALALVLLLRAAASRAGLSARAQALAPWTLLLTDFSFVFAANSQAHWWCDLLRGNLLLSLALANPAVPALALALGALVSLSRAAEGGAGGAPRGHLLLAALQAAAVPHFKVFLGAHLLLGLLAWGLLRPAARRAAVVAGLPCLVSTAVLAFGRGGESVGVFIDPLELVRATRLTLGLDPLHGAALWGWALAWLAASLGMRVFGLPAAARALGSGPGLGAALAAMALAGWPLGLLFRVSAPAVLPGEPVVNDAAYLVEQSGPLLWIFTAAALADLARTPARRVLRGLALALALPSTLHFAAKKATLPLDPFPAARLRAAHVAAALTQPGEVVLQRPGGRYPPGPVAFASRRVPYERFTPYLTQFAPRAALEERHAQVAAFFRTREAREARALATALGARVVCLYDGERVRFPIEGLLDEVHAEPGARVYRIVASRPALKHPARGSP
jgi:hypothetical protein